MPAARQTVVASPTAMLCYHRGVAEQLGDASEQEPEPVPTSERFGRYELIVELASGGMASVYLARLPSQDGVQRVVAIKRIHPHLAKAAGFAEMFLDEARIAARIDHPNVCQVMEHGRENGVSFLAMEFLAGEPLQRVVPQLRFHPGDPTRRAMIIATLVAEAADGLHAAHELRDANGASLEVVHRDVSPHNLFVTFDGAVKVVDFGIASAANQVHHTETGTVKGKFAYMAPESLNGARADRRVDVWALGVVLWEMLTLRRLFRRESPSEVVHAVESMPIDAPSSVRDDLPDTLDAIVMRALERDPEDRYATARELARDLRAVVRSSGIAVDRAVIAEWMAELFPDGEAKRRAWLKNADEATPPPLAAPSSLVPESTRTERVQTPAPRPWAALAVGLVVVLAVSGAAAWAWPRPQPALVVAPVSVLAAPLPPVVAPDAVEPLQEVEPPQALEPAPSIAVAAPPTSIAPRVHAHREIAAPVATEVVASGPDGCLTLGGGITATIDGTSYEGPRARCIATSPGVHRVAVSRLPSGEPAYTQSVSVAPGARLAITSNGIH